MRPISDFRTVLLRRDLSCLPPSLPLPLGGGTIAFFIFVSGWILFVWVFMDVWPAAATTLLGKGGYVLQNHLALVNERVCLFFDGLVHHQQ